MRSLYWPALMFVNLICIVFGAARLTLAVDGWFWWLVGCILLNVASGTVCALKWAAGAERDDHR